MYGSNERTPYTEIHVVFLQNSLCFFAKSSSELKKNQVFRLSLTCVIADYPSYPAHNHPLPQVPFLSVGGDLGAATRVCSGRSDWCGPYVVEDVTVDGGTLLRRLVFLDNPNVVQSEARLRINGKCEISLGPITSTLSLSFFHY